MEPIVKIVKKLSPVSSLTALHSIPIRHGIDRTYY